MRAQDAMTKVLITVGPDTTVGEIARLLITHRLSAVPVVTDGRLIGLVSQTDLGHRVETGTKKRRKWWLEAFGNPDAMARDYIKAHGCTAKEVMTHHIISVSKEATLAEIADVLDANGIRQVPVMDEGKLVGMIGHADLVRVLAAAQVAAPAPRPSDGALQASIWRAIKAQSWLSSAYLNLAVKDGVVELYGAAASSDQRRAVKVLVEGVPGVVKVEDKMGVFPKVVAA
jgi:CBS domain-containing protein